MKLPNYLTPWRTIAALRDRVAYLEGRFDEITERAEYAEARAFDRAARYYQFQLERARETEKQAMAQVMQTAALTPLPPLIVQMVKGLNDAENQ